MAPPGGVQGTACVTSLQPWEREALYGTRARKELLSPLPQHCLGRSAWGQNWGDIYLREVAFHDETAITKLFIELS